MLVVHCHAGISRSGAVARFVSLRHGLPFDPNDRPYNPLLFRLPCEEEGRRANAKKNSKLHTRNAKIPDMTKPRKTGAPRVFVTKNGLFAIPCPSCQALNGMEEMSCQECAADLPASRPFGDETPTPRQRAENAVRAIAAHANKPMPVSFVPGDISTDHVTDLLADVMHLCRIAGFVGSDDFESILESARIHFLAETEGKG